MFPSSPGLSILTFKYPNNNIGKCCINLLKCDSQIPTVSSTGSGPGYTYSSKSLALFLCLLLLIMGMDIEVNPGPGNPTKGLSLVHLNIQSLYMSSIKSNPRVKLDEVYSTYAIDKDVDIICMSETWLHDNIDDDQIMLAGYQEPYRNDRPNRGGGGVCAYVTNNIISNRLKNLEPPSIDLLWLEVPLSNKRIIVGVGYRPPGQNREEVERFLDEFRTSLSNVIALGAESIVLVGDFNDRCTTWDSNHVLSELKNDFYDMLNAFDMVQLVNEITHTVGDTESLLDLIITDSPGFVQSFALLPPLGSKHVTLYLDFISRQSNSFH